MINIVPLRPNHAKRGALVMFSLVLAGCVVHAPISSGKVDMVPDVTIKSDGPIRKSVRVVEVVSADKTPLPSTYSDPIRAAIVAALIKAKAFTTVSRDVEGDLDLRVIVISSEITKMRELNSFEARMTTTIRYEFVDIKSGVVVWRDTFRGTGGSTTAHVSAYTEAREIGVRETIASLVEGVSFRWN